MASSQIKIKDTVRTKLNAYLSLLLQLNPTSDKLSYSDVVDHALDEAFKNGTKKIRKRNEREASNNES